MQKQLDADRALLCEYGFKCGNNRKFVIIKLTVQFMNFIQQKSPTSVSGEMNAYWYSIQWGFKPRLNKVKASGGCHRFSEEIYRAELDKI